MHASCSLSQAVNNYKQVETARWSFLIKEKKKKEDLHKMCIWQSHLALNYKSEKWLKEL